MYIVFLIYKITILLNIFKDIFKLKNEKTS